MKFDTVAALEFMKLFAGRHWLQTFDDPRKNKDARGELLTDWQYELTELPNDQNDPENEFGFIANQLMILNEEEAGVYFCVNSLDSPKLGRLRRSSDNVDSIRAFFVDLDGSPLQPVLDCALRPNVVVQTSENKWHAYWLLQEPIAADKKLFRAMQQALAARFKGDRSISDLCRVMRIPGFYNMKKPAEPFLIKWSAIGNSVNADGKNVEGFVPVARYNLEELKNEFLRSDTIDSSAKRIGAGCSLGCDDVDLLQTLVADAGRGNAWDTDAVDLGLLRGALLAVSADDYNVWINIGIALKGAVVMNELDEAVAEEFWHAWSETSAEYDEVLAAAKWAGFNSSGEKGLGSVFFAAKENGWKGAKRNYWNAEEMQKYLAAM